MTDETDRAKKIQLEKKRIVSRQHAEDAYERPGDLYRVIADAAGLGWLHLPSQEVFDAMQDRRRANPLPIPPHGVIGRDNYCNKNNPCPECEYAGQRDPNCDYHP